MAYDFSLTGEKFKKLYWNYYNLLEQDFINTLQYVALDYDNFDCFSNEYIKLLELICSEV